MNEVFSTAVCHIHVIARGAFDKVAKLLKTRSWTTFSLSGAVLHMAILSADLHIEILSDDLHMAILFADLYIVILSAYWNTIHRSGCIEISSANLHICIYIEILSSNLQNEILSQQHIYAAEKCNFQFATKETKKCDPVSKRTVKPQKNLCWILSVQWHLNSFFSI